jgi:UPF0716 protein FxsA
VPILLLVVFLVVPVVEIYVLIQVGQAIGAGWTVALLIADAIVGTWLFKREGRKAWTALRTALAEQRVPAKEVADGALVVAGGAFLITPGFVSDVFGVLCLLPPTRALLRVVLTGFFSRRLLGPSASRLPRTGRPSGSRPSPGRRTRKRDAHEVIEGEIVDPPDHP